MTSSEITSQAPSQEMLYRTDKMTWMQAFAGFHGLRQGLIRYEDLPAGPGEDDPNGYAWRRDVQALLERTGTIDSYRRALLDGAYAAD
ncbi:MAG TPA: hypothetical protein VF288_00525, partial [Mycobacteriales bacterium]